jgi:transposase InsO family protein
LERGEATVDSELRRRRWIVHRKLEHWKSGEIATALRVDERTVYRWWRVYRKEGWAGVTPKSRAPHKYWKTPQETVTLILQLRRERNWGPCRIEGYLKNYGKVNPVGHTTIHKILNQAGLNKPIPRPRRVWRTRRFQREHSNSLWQADFKLTSEDEWMISYLDDHSRFIPGSRVHHNPTAEHAIHLLEECVKSYGKPKQILTDRGTQFYPARGGESEFTEFCTGNGIQHIVTSVRRPSTIGKIEAFHKAYTIEAPIYPTHQAFVNYWNYERPHQGLGYLYPADVYFKDLLTHLGG